MKFFNQEGAGLKQTHLSESDNVCECCQVFDHGAADLLHDDVECPRCGALCRCACHRETGWVERAA